MLESQNSGQRPGSHLRFLGFRYTAAEFNETFPGGEPYGIQHNFNIELGRGASVIQRVFNVKPAKPFEPGNVGSV